MSVSPPREETSTTLPPRVIPGRLSDVRTWKHLPDDGRRPSSIDSLVIIGPPFWRDVADIMGDLMSYGGGSPCTAPQPPRTPPSRAAGDHTPLTDPDGQPHEASWLRFSSEGRLPADGLWGALRDLGADCSLSFAECLIDRFGGTRDNGRFGSPCRTTSTGPATPVTHLTEAEYSLLHNAVSTAMHRCKMAVNFRLNSPTAPPRAASLGRGTNEAASKDNASVTSGQVRAPRSPSPSTTGTPRRTASASAAGRRSAAAITVSQLHSSHTIKSLATQWARTAVRAELERKELDFQLRRQLLCGRQPPRNTTSRATASRASPLPSKRTLAHAAAGGHGGSQATAGDAPAGAPSFPPRNGVTSSYRRIRFDRYGNVVYA